MIIPVCSSVWIGGSIWLWLKSKVSVWSSHYCLWWWFFPLTDKFFRVLKPWSLDEQHWAPGLDTWCWNQSQTALLIVGKPRWISQQFRFCPGFLQPMNFSFLQPFVVRFAIYVEAVWGYKAGQSQLSKKYSITDYSRDGRWKIHVRETVSTSAKI